MILDRQLMVLVYGRPAPKGSLRVVGRGKHRNVIEDNPNVDAWRALIARAGRAWKLDEPIDGPLIAEMTITLDRPTTVTPGSRPWPSKRSPGHGDIDKLARAVLDGLQDAGVFTDDAQVVELIARKVYPDTPGIADVLKRPGAAIRLYPIDP